MKKLLFALLLIPSMSLANEIYITQSGDSLDLDILQDGQNNTIGTSSQDAVFTGDDMVFNIVQQGDTNSITAIIKGNTYSADWDFIGSSNSIDLLCDSAAAGNCETVTLDISNNASSNTYKIYIGEVADAGSLVADFTVTSDNNVWDVDIDGASVALTVNVSDGSSLVTTAVTSATDGTLSASSGGSIFDINIDGDGDVVGHEVDLTVVGVSSVYTITQSGIYDNKIVASFTGDEQTVDITQSD